MKLLIILCVEELQELMASILHDSGITCMSVANITGYRKCTAGTSLNWFGRDTTCEHADSLMMFSFTSEDTAHKAIAIIDKYNETHACNFPPRGYVMDVAEFSKLTCHE